MPRAASTRKLSKLALRLIAQDLRRIAEMMPNKPPGEYDLVLTRYYSAISDRMKMDEKLEDAIRAVLKKMPKKQLEELAGLKKEAAKGKSPKDA